MRLIDLCVSAALDAVKAGVTLPWSDTKMPTEGPASVVSVNSTTDASGEAGARVLVAEDDADAWDESLTSTDPPFASPAESPSLTDAGSASSDTAAPEHPHRVISFLNFEKALKEITPSSSESLGTLSELRKWNDEFGEGKREKRRNMWGKGSFGFVEEGEGQGEIKIAAGGQSSTQV